MSWYPHANKLLQKRTIFNEAINMHSRGPVEQHFYVWEPHCGCCLQAKKVQFYTPLVGGQRSNKYAFWRANVAIKMKNVLVPPCSILLNYISWKFNMKMFLTLFGPGFSYHLKVQEGALVTPPPYDLKNHASYRNETCTVIVLLKAYQNTLRNFQKSGL